MLVASSALADETVWNPFLFTAYCSTCGPQTPLTLEQVDAVQVLMGGTLGPGPAVPLVPIDDGNDFNPPMGGVGNGAKPTFPLLPAPAVGPGNANGNSGSGGSSDSGVGHDHNSNDQNDSGGENHTGGLDYGVDVGEGPSAGENVVTFTTADNMPLDPLSDTPTSGGGSGQTLIPEPTTLLLFGSGLALVSARMRKRR